MQSTPHAIEYLTPGEGSFWKWDFAESAVTWKSGATIAFATELAQILNPLCGSGLPRFDLVVLLVASTRDSWSLLGDDPEIDDLFTSYIAANLPNWESCSNFAASLDRISLLSSDLRHGTSTKTVLLHSLLAEHPRRCRAENSRTVVTLLEQGGPSGLEVEPWPLVHPDIASRSSDLNQLAKRIYELGDDNLRMLMTTSIEEPVEAALLESLPAACVQARALIQSLQADIEYAAAYRGIGRISRDLIGVLHRTPHLTHDRSVATGGLSDISNRGTVDRLLLSELAYDDDVLAVRVANNEAMYLRREPPSHRPPLDRCILLDSGIWAWGTPRLYAAAVGLALVALADKKATVHVWRANGDEVIDVRLHDRGGLVQHLKALTPELHPGEALAPFFAKSDSIGAIAEKYLITTRDAWRQVEFQQILQTSSRAGLTAIVVDRAGNLEMIEVTQAGQNTIRTAQLDLSTLLSRSADLPVQTTGLPRILDIAPFPLRVPFQAKRMYQIDKSTVVAKSYDNRLLLKNSDRFGALQIRDSGVNGSIVWAAKWHACGYILFGTDQNKNHCLVTVDLCYGTSTYGTSFQSDMVTSALTDCVNFRVESKCLIGYSMLGAKAVSLANGTLVATYHWKRRLDTPSSVVQHEPSCWFNLQFDGTKFSELKVLSREEALGLNVHTVIERIDRKGFVYLTRDGDVLNSADGYHYSLRGVDREPVVIVNIECLGNGQWVAVEYQLSGTHQCVLLRFDERGRVRESSIADSVSGFARAYDRVVQGKFRLPNMSFRNRFSKVGVFDGKLTLARNSSLLTLHMEHDSLAWRSSACGQPRIFPQMVAFEMLSLDQTKRGYRLDKAILNGCELYLDGRGLLHLKNPLNVSPEITIALKDGVTSGYCSDRKWFGEPAYIGQQRGCTAEEIYNDLRALDIGIE